MSRLTFKQMKRHAHKIVTDEGRTYYSFPHVYFEESGTGGWLVHDGELPEDLSMFICKEGLGGDNPQIEK